MTVGFVSLGCAKNKVDAEIMMGLLREAGHELVADPACAEVLIVNTCGFIEAAKRESIDAILDMAEYKREGACRILIVAGCLSGRYRTELVEEMPEVDIFLSVADVGRIAEAIEAAAEARPFLTGGDVPRYVEGAARVLTSPPGSAYVKIADGCDNRCAYCAIPGIRGGFVGRPMDAILRECASLWTSGVQEINLIAQDITRWGVEEGRSLSELIGALAKESGGKWLRVLYAHPARVDDRLLDALVQGGGVCPYLDIPIQHANDEILHAMGRRGDRAGIVRVHEGARARGITLRTTVIVGFPGETEAQFEELCDFLGAYPFDRLGAFTYSPEEGTAAYTLGDPIPEEEKARRRDRIMELQRERSLKLNLGRVGNETDVLIEGRRRGHLFGRSPAEAPESDGNILIDTRDSIAPGSIVRVRLAQAAPYDMIGTLKGERP